MAIEHADFEGVERLAAVTGGATASTFDHPELAVLGECKKIEEVKEGWHRTAWGMGWVRWSTGWVGWDGVRYKVGLEMGPGVGSVELEVRLVGVGWSET